MNAPPQLKAFHEREGETALPDARFLVETPVAELTIVLLPGFSQLCLASLVEPLHIANKLTQRVHFKWRLIGQDGGSVTSASGFKVAVSATLDDENKRISAGQPGRIFLCAGEGVENHINPSLLRLVRSCVRMRVPLVALGSATFVLAHAGLLDDASCTVHWPQIVTLSERFGRLNVQNSLFVSDGLMTTCAGEFAAFDFVIDLIGKQFGDELVRGVCALALADRWRSGEQHQSAPPGLSYSGTSGKLITVVRLMEKHVDEVLSIDNLAREIGLSRRQIERLFQQHLGTTPWQYYTGLRLERAKQMIRFTDMPIIEIAVACGFQTASHFTKCFRTRFNTSPSTLRRSSLIGLKPVVASGRQRGLTLGLDAGDDVVDVVGTTAA
ncbi:GlxA family transcriptional regulator [Mesorhizobium sp. 131-2-1]|uniref:GlxA family transcriptional regulator n=1 Tax=Mesorhizobium sp. 131-2-1 TaxID=2744518 RepID=UPI0018EDFB30|nr:GlxA family transcriptional regulator [Mesorhizobium sp. 131-2-1]